MSFGRRSPHDDPGAAETDTANQTWLFAAVATVVAVLLVGGLTYWFSTETDSTTRFEQAAAKLGITDTVRAELRLKFQTALLNMEADVCEEGLRDEAGKAAVLYYETLLEKPVTEAGLTITYDSRCQQRLPKDTHALEFLIAQRGLGKNLVLPWACMPSRWRTPIDRALQSKLEHIIGSGRLTSESLSGTLAVLAKPTKLSSLKGVCTRTQSFGPPRQYPVLPGPNDAALQTRRRATGTVFSR